MKVTTLIRLALIILFSSCALATIGLISENKISVSYDKIEEIRKEKKLIKMWQLGFFDKYSQANAEKMYAADFYLFEKDEVKEINKCIRYWHIARSSTLLQWAIPDYSKFSVQKFYNPIIFNKTKKTLDNFLEWNKKNRKGEPCLEQKNRVYIIESANELTEFYPYYLNNLNKILTVFYEKEKLLYESIETESSKASKFYLITFLILALSTFLIIFVDTQSNRGNK